MILNYTHTCARAVRTFAPRSKHTPPRL